MAIYYKNDSETGICYVSSKNKDGYSITSSSIPCGTSTKVIIEDKIKVPEQASSFFSGTYVEEYEGLNLLDMSDVKSAT